MNSQLPSKWCDDGNADRILPATDSNNESNALLSLTQLPTDILLIIFSLCGPAWWPSLAQVCHHFNQILGPNSFLWEQISKQLLIVNQHSHAIQLRSFGRLSARDKCRVYKYWQKGMCSVKPITSISERHVLPWLVLKAGILWMGAGNKINAYKRTQPRIFSKTAQSNAPTIPCVSLASCTGDIGRFVVKNGMVAAGDTTGSLALWNASTGRLQFKKENCHESEISCVGLFKSLIVSGGRDTMLKIWRHTNWRDTCALQEVCMEDRVLSLDIDPSGSMLCTGTGGHNSNVPPSKLFDLTTGTLMSSLRTSFRNGEGVYDVRFESPHEVLTADFNSALRLWDTRTNHNVAVWEDPHDSAVNCIASDHNLTMMTATATHGGVRLWDKRQAKCVQLYFVRPDLRSPVYCLDFDPTEMYAALDSLITGFDFTAGRHKPTNSLTVFSCH